MMSDLNILALIPARGGSKRIPNKNLWPVAGIPLLAHSIRHAVTSKYVAEVCVTTDDEDIANIAEKYGASVILRPHVLANDTATSESALIHALDERKSIGIADPDIVLFLQCTSPIRRPFDIDQAIEQFMDENIDSMFSAYCDKHYIWEKEGEELKTLTYDYKNRSRAQDFKPQYRENGSIFLFRPDTLRKFNNRLAGKVGVYEMDYWSSFDIDTFEHLELIDWVLKRPEYSFVDKFPKEISLLVFDFDGVMTDNYVSVSQSGEESVRCNRADGLGISNLKKAGIPMMVLSTEENKVVEERCKKLSLECFHGIKNKGVFLEGYLKDKDISAENVIYVGNDVNDLDCFKLVGCPVAVADANPKVIELARVVLKNIGGNGAVRELCDMLLCRELDE